VRKEKPSKESRCLPRCGHPFRATISKHKTLVTQRHREKSKVGRIDMLGNEEWSQ